MQFLKKSEEKKKQDLEKSLQEQQKELQKIKAKEAKAKKQAEKEERKKRLAEKKQKMKEQRFWIHKKPSQRLLKLILNLSTSENPYKYFQNHVKDNDSHNLRPFLEKLDELEG